MSLGGYARPYAPIFQYDHRHLLRVSTQMIEKMQRRNRISKIYTLRRGPYPSKPSEGLSPSKPQHDPGRPKIASRRPELAIEIS